MNNETQQLKDMIQRLQGQLERLQQDFDMHYHDGTNSAKVNFSDLFNIGATNGTYPTHSTSVPSGGGTVIAPAQPTGTIAITIGNKTYNIPYQ